MFAAAFDDRFVAAAWSDPGIAWDESRPNVNYWEPWYLGGGEGDAPGVSLRDADGTVRRKGAYARLRAAGADLHELQALMAPRPFLVSGGEEDPPERRWVLEQVERVNQRLGQPHRVAYTSRPTHEPTPESNATLYQFFDHFLRSR